MKPQSFIPINKKITLMCAMLIAYSQYVWPAVFTVTNTADSGAGSLRQAIINSNGTLGPNTINFAIPGAGPFTIAPLTDLPNITNTVTIDGYSQPGSSVNTLAVGDNAVLKIILNGSNYTVGDGNTTGIGLFFDTGSDGSVVRGLVINQWLLAGILIAPSTAIVSNISIVGNFIGTDSTGTQVMANGIGVGLSGNNYPVNVQNTNIGTTAVADRNIFAGSFGFGTLNSYGELFGGCISSFFNQGTSIVNNYIGTDRTGTIALGNSVQGIILFADLQSTIGGTTSVARNIISGQTILGIKLQVCSEVLVQGNYVGTDITGTKALGNQNIGISINYPFSLVGYTTGSSIIGNLVSGNGTGIRVGDADLVGAILNTVQGNYVGTDVTGTKPLPNNFWGMIVNDAQNAIGGSAANQFNLVSGNLIGGILVYGVPATDNIFSYNFIGTDISGTKVIPNGGNGIQIGLYGGLGGASNNTFN